MIKFQASDVKDSLDDTWIASVQSPVQRELLDAHPHDVSIFVEGAFRIWLRNASVSYFILRADPRPKPNLHPQDFDGMHSNHYLEQILTIFKNHRFTPILQYHVCMHMYFPFCNFCIDHQLSYNPV